MRRSRWKLNSPDQEWRPDVWHEPLNTIVKRISSPYRSLDLYRTSDGTLSALFLHQQTGIQLRVESHSKERVLSSEAIPYYAMGIRSEVGDLYRPLSNSYAARTTLDIHRLWMWITKSYEDMMLWNTLKKAAATEGLEIRAEEIIVPMPDSSNVYSLHALKPKHNISRNPKQQLGKVTNGESSAMTTPSPEATKTTITMDVDDTTPPMTSNDAFTTNTRTNTSTPSTTATDSNMAEKSRKRRRISREFAQVRLNDAAAQSDCLRLHHRHTTSLDKQSTNPNTNTNASTSVSATGASSSSSSSASSSSSTTTKKRIQSEDGEYNHDDADDEYDDGDKDRGNLVEDAKAQMESDFDVALSQDLLLLALKQATTIMQHGQQLDTSRFPLFPNRRVVHPITHPIFSPAISTVHHFRQLLSVSRLLDDLAYTVPRLTGTGPLHTHFDATSLATVATLHITFCTLHLRFTIDSGKFVISPTEELEEPIQFIQHLTQTFASYLIESVEQHVNALCGPNAVSLIHSRALNFPLGTTHPLAPRSTSKSSSTPGSSSTSLITSLYASFELPYSSPFGLIPVLEVHPRIPGISTNTSIKWPMDTDIWFQLPGHNFAEKLTSLIVSCQ